jgi:hypothetical protein
VLLISHIKVVARGSKCTVCSYVGVGVTVLQFEGQKQPAISLKCHNPPWDNTDKCRRAPHDAVKLLIRSGQKERIDGSMAYIDREGNGNISLLGLLSYFNYKI